MQFDLKNTITLVSMVVAATSAVFAFQISTQDGINDLTQRVAALEQAPAGLTPQDIDALVQDKIDSLGLQTDNQAQAPAGQVIASIRRCRDLGVNWVDFQPAEGRMIVGVGSGSDGTMTRIFRLDEVDGAYEHLLTKDEMPMHDHQGTTGGATGPRILTNTQDDGSQQFSAGKVGDAVSNGFSLNVQLSNAHDHTIATEGLGQRHNNMPPYLALYYCVSID